MLLDFIIIFVRCTIMIKQRKGKDEESKIGNYTQSRQDHKLSSDKKTCTT